MRGGKSNVATGKGVPAVASKSKKVDVKLIAEDFKKYEDKTSKKIKEGK